MRVLVTGDRHWFDWDTVFAALDDLHNAFGISEVIEGCADGADSMSGDHYVSVAEGRGLHRIVWVPRPGWAKARGVDGSHFRADWDRLGRGAGPIRNRQMLAIGRPELVVAFHADLSHSAGTADMIRAAREDGLDVHLYTGRPNEAVILPGRRSE